MASSKVDGLSYKDDGYTIWRAEGLGEGQIILEKKIYMDAKSQ